MGVRIERLLELPAAHLASLTAESEKAGLRFVSRLAEEWENGRNRFDRPGEALFGGLTDTRLVSVCGLNVDPYAGEPRIGRGRRLYVAIAHRQHGVGRQLVGAVVAAALDRFATLRLSPANPQAVRLYETLGFRPRAGDVRCTHVMEIAAVP